MHLGGIEFNIVLFTDWCFASGCSQPRFSTTQLPSATDRPVFPSGRDFHPSVGAYFQAHIGVGTKVGFAPPSEPDWQFSCIRLSSWWLTFKKISRRILLNFKVRSVVVSRYRGGR